jgi:hypothetical protein
LPNDCGRLSEEGALVSGKWQLWESKTVADMSALERHKRDPDAISEPDRQLQQAPVVRLANNVQLAVAN